MTIHIYESAMHDVGFSPGGTKATSNGRADAGAALDSLILGQLRRIRCQHCQACPLELSGDRNRCGRQHHALDNSHSNGKLTKASEPLSATFGWPKFFEDGTDSEP